MWNDSNTQNNEQNIMFKSQCSHMWLQKSILSHVTILTFVVTCDYIDFFLANVTVNHNVQTFTIIVHGYLFHSCLINVINYNVHFNEINGFLNWRPIFEKSSLIFFLVTWNWVDFLANSINWKLFKVIFFHVNTLIGCVIINEAKNETIIDVIHW